MLFNSYQGPEDLRRRVMANNMSDARFTSSGPNVSANLEVPQPYNKGMMQPAPLGGRQLNDVESGKKNSKRAPASMAVIEPPPEIRKTVEITALLISKNGLEMERRVMALNINDARFRFLWSSDPYHAFYYHKLTEYRAQLIQPDSPASHECVGEAAKLHLEPPQHLSTQITPRMLMRPPLPLHDESALVPEEDKFLDQQPCSSTIGDDWEVIDIPVVQSLSENVASLKE